MLTFLFRGEGMKELVNGIGFNDRKYLAMECGKHLKEYKVWQSMLSRCTKKFWETNPSYNGCSVSEPFKSYSYFYEWCQTQKGFKNRDDKGNSWCLDKDILLKNNKMYSENLCVFVPARLNILLTKRDVARGEYLVGVCWIKQKSRFMATCNIGSGVKKTIGVFDNEQEAFQAYKSFKEALIKQVVSEYKGQIDDRAYQALMNYTINEKD